MGVCVRACVYAARRVYLHECRKSRDVSSGRSRREEIVVVVNDDIVNDGTAAAIAAGRIATQRRPSDDRAVRSARAIPSFIPSS